MFFSCQVDDCDIQRRETTMELYNLDNRYKKFVETLVDGYVLGKSHMEDGSNPYISEPGLKFSNIFCDFTDNLACNLILHKAAENSVNVCYVFDSRLINSEGGDKYEAQERFINIKHSDFIYKLTLLKWLEDSGYIVLIDDANCNLFATGLITEHDRKRWDDSGFLCIEKTENSEFVYETLSRYHNCRIIPSAQLIDIRNNNFKTIEQRRFEKQLKEAKRSTCWSRVASIIAFITLIFTLCQTCCDKQNGSKQINRIVSVIKEHKTVSIDSVKVLPNDTFNVNVIQSKVPKQQDSLKQPIPQN